MLNDLVQCYCLRMQNIALRGELEERTRELENSDRLLMKVLKPQL